MDRFHPIRIEVLATSQHEAQAIALEILNENEIGARPAVEARTISAHDVENLRRGHRPRSTHHTIPTSTPHPALGTQQTTGTHMNITPSQARDLLNGTTPGPWKWRWDTGALSIFGVEGEPVATDLDVRDSDMIAAAPDMAHQIANMAWEYAAQVQLGPGTPWKYITPGGFFTSLPHLARWRSVESEATLSEYSQHKYPTRIVRRLVSTAEVTE